MLFPNTFEDIIEKGLTIERVIIVKGVIKLYNNSDQTSNSNGKPHIWVKYKNATNDGVVHAKFFQNIQPLPNNPQNNIQTNQVNYPKKNQ